MNIKLPGMDRAQAEQLVAGGAPGLPVLERDAEQHRRAAEGGLKSATAATADAVIDRAPAQMRPRRVATGASNQPVRFLSLYVRARAS